MIKIYVKGTQIISMLQGVYTAVRKDGTIYYRSNITYKSKHISLGSFDSELSASRAYATASTILLKETNSIEDSYFHTHALAFDKIVTLINFRDNGMYIKTPIYLRKTISATIWIYHMS